MYNAIQTALTATIELIAIAGLTGIALHAIYANTVKWMNIYCPSVGTDATEATEEVVEEVIEPIAYEYACPLTCEVVLPEIKEEVKPKRQRKSTKSVEGAVKKSRKKAETPKEVDVPTVTKARKPRAKKATA